jgi:WD40 repeat protein
VLPAELGHSAATIPFEIPMEGKEMAMFQVRIFWCVWAFLVNPLLIHAQQPTLRFDLSESPCGSIEALAFSPDSKLLAATHGYGVLRLWDTATGKLVGKIDRFVDGNAYLTNQGLVFSPDGKTLAGAASSSSGLVKKGTIFLWNIKDDKSIQQKALLEEHTEGVQSIVFTPDGKNLLSASLDKEIRVWDLTTRKTTHILRGHRERILAMAISSDGKVLVTGDPEEVKVWNLETNKETISWKVVDLIKATISPDGKTVAISSFPKGSITFWDAASGKQKTDPKPLRENYSPVAFSSDGKRFISTYREWEVGPVVTITDLTRNCKLASYVHNQGDDHVHSIAISPDGKLLASGTYHQGGRAHLFLMDVSKIIPRKGRE